MFIGNISVGFGKIRGDTLIRLEVLVRWIDEVAF